MPNGFFITGTDTDAGKSYIGCQLVSCLDQEGVTVQPRKPIESGCRWLNGELMPSDGIGYHQATGKKIPLNIITPYRFEPAIAPPQAMTEENSVSLEQAIAAIYANSAPKDIFIVEGAGGFYSPLCVDASNADLATALQLPVILVVANKVGCINHCLLSIDAILNKRLHLAAIILNDIDNNNDLLQKNRHSIDHYIKKQCSQFNNKVICMPHKGHITDEIKKIVI